MRLFRLMLLSTLLILIAAVGFVITSKQQTRPWPGKYLVIEDRSERNEDLSRAVTKINATGIGLRIVISNDNPDVVIEAADGKLVQSICESRKCVGHASFIGYRDRQEKIVLSREHLAQYEEVDDLIIHEIGHILGLRHSNNKCRIMGKKSILTNCEDDYDWQRCGFQRAEVIALGELYGRKGNYDPWCPFFAETKNKPPTTITSDNREIDNKGERKRFEVSRDTPGIIRRFQGDFLAVER